MTYEVTTYSRYDRDAVVSLVHANRHTHRHIDWRTLREWLDDPGIIIRLARAGGQVVGCMAATPPYNSASWLRLIAIAEDQKTALLLDALWPQIRLALESYDVTRVAVLAMRDWMTPYLPALGFRVVNQVITLKRASSRLPVPLRADLIIRPVRQEDLDAIVEVDNAAFTPIWQYGARDIRDASKVAARFTLAELNGRVAGYQLSTAYKDSVHLVRLATAPSLQGMGVGGMLLGEAIEHFAKRRYKQMTVNTQADNYTSQQLYRRFGFVEADQNVAVWAIDLP